MGSSHLKFEKKRKIQKQQPIVKNQEPRGLATRYVLEKSFFDPGRPA
jgi:hypothetical protein